MTRHREFSTWLSLLLALLVSIGTGCSEDRVTEPEPDDEFTVQIDAGTHVVTHPDGHAAIELTVTGDTEVSISPLPDPNEPGDCSTFFAFDVPQDCFPLGFDFTVDPESNLDGVATIGLCLVDPPDPLAPDPDILPRVRIASEDPADTGILIFHPLATAPATVDCTDLARAGRGPGDRRGNLWRAMDPFEGLFRVTPLYAAPGRLGASVSSFSPFAPADPGMEATTTTLEVSQTVLDDGDSATLTATVVPPPALDEDPQTRITVTDDAGNEETLTLDLDAKGQATAELLCDVFGEFQQRETDFRIGGDATVQAEFLGTLGFEASASQEITVECSFQGSS